MGNKGRPLPEFEYDERKSRINKLKHGIDFVEVQALWLDEGLRERDATRGSEVRFLVAARSDRDTGPQ